MKICISYPVNGVGGPFTFVKNFTAEAEQQGHAVTDTIGSDTAICLVIAECPRPILQTAKDRNIPIIQRLDGVYHPGIPGLTGYLYRWKNRNVKRIYRHYADYLIYQSDFARQSVERVFGKTSTRSTKIYNGVPINAGAAQPAVHTPLQLVTWGKFRRPDQIIPLIESVKKLKQSYQFTIFGPLTSSLRRTVEHQIQDHPILLAGHLPESPKHLSQQYDIFLFSDQSACPNAVLEALSYGLPVVAFERGATKELVTANHSGEIVPLRPHDPFRQSYPFTTADCVRYAAAISRAAHRHSIYSQAARRDAAARFSISRCASEYLAVFQRAVAG